MLDPWGINPVTYKYIPLKSTANTTTFYAEYIKWLKQFIVVMY